MDSTRVLPLGFLQRKFFTPTPQDFGEPYIEEIQAEHGVKGADLYDWTRRAIMVKYAILSNRAIQDPALAEQLLHVLNHAFDPVGSPNANPLCRLLDDHDDHHCIFCRRFAFHAAYFHVFPEETPELSTESARFIVARYDRLQLPESEPKFLISYHFWIELARDSLLAIIPPCLIPNATQEQRMRLLKVLDDHNLGDEIWGGRYTNECILELANLEGYTASDIGFSETWPHAGVCQAAEPREAVDAELLLDVAIVLQDQAARIATIEQRISSRD